MQPDVRMAAAAMLGRLMAVWWQQDPASVTDRLDAFQCGTADEQAADMGGHLWARAHRVCGHGPL